MYSIEVSAAELDVIRLAIGRMVEAKKVRARKPAAPVEVFAPNTGDRALDDFMRRHHDPKWKPLPLPKVLDNQSNPQGDTRLAYTDLSQNRLRGGDKRPLAKVIEEHAAHAKKHGWPGTINVIGEKIS